MINQLTRVRVRIRVRVVINVGVGVNVGVGLGQRGAPVRLETPVRPTTSGSPAERWG